MFRSSSFWSEVFIRVQSVKRSFVIVLGKLSPLYWRNTLSLCQKQEAIAWKAMNLPDELQARTIIATPFLRVNTFSRELTLSSCTDDSNSLLRLKSLSRSVDTILSSSSFIVANNNGKIEDDDSKLTTEEREKHSLRLLKIFIEKQHNKTLKDQIPISDKANALNALQASDDSNKLDNEMPERNRTHSLSSILDQEEGNDEYKTGREKIEYSDWDKDYEDQEEKEKFSKEGFFNFETIPVSIRVLQCGHISSLSQRLTKKQTTMIIKGANPHRPSSVPFDEKDIDVIQDYLDRSLLKSFSRDHQHMITSDEAKDQEINNRNKSEKLGRKRRRRNIVTMTKDSRLTLSLLYERKYTRILTFEKLMFYIICRLVILQYPLKEEEHQSGSLKGGAKVLNNVNDPLVNNNKKKKEIRNNIEHAELKQEEPVFSLSAEVLKKHQRILLQKSDDDYDPSIPWKESPNPQQMTAEIVKQHHSGSLPFPSPLFAFGTVSNEIEDLAMLVVMNNYEMDVQKSELLAILPEIFKLYRPIKGKNERNLMWNNSPSSISSPSTTQKLTVLSRIDSNDEDYWKMEEIEEFFTDFHHWYSANHSPIDSPASNNKLQQQLFSQYQRRDDSPVYTECLISLVAFKEWFQEKLHSMEKYKLIN
jgi:hypothetical protein